jgi:hypothetical protein
VRPLLDWTERGRELAASLGSCHAVVVVGSDAVATAEVALGVAREHAMHRKVAVADLFGDAPPLSALISGDDPHGIVDSFLFGVSLNRIAQPVPDAGELFILPTGTAPLDYDELFPHPRWRRLVAGFREVNALLLLVAPAGAEHLRELVDATDGAVIVGDTVPADLSVAQSLAWLRPKRSGQTSVVGLPPLASVADAEPVAAKAPANKKRVVGMVVSVVLVLLLGGAALWFAYRPFASKRPVRKGVAPGASPLATTLKPDSAHADSVRVDSTRMDSLRRDSVARAASAGPALDSFPLLAPSNAADSAQASAYAVRLEQTNTKSGAILDLRGRFETVPAGTYGFDLRTRFFLLVAGAYPTKAAAESLLLQLRAHKILAPGIGSVTSLPFAFLVQADVPAADVASRLARFAARGQPVYALRQPSGVAHLYFGAYESPQQAALAVPAVREAGLSPTLVYRIGRVF